MCLFKDQSSRVSVQSLSMDKIWVTLIALWVNLKYVAHGCIILNHLIHRNHHSNHNHQIGPPTFGDNIFNVVIWYRQSFISLILSFLSCNCYLICIILYVRKRKFDQLQFFLSVPTSVSDSDNLSIWSQDEAHLYFLFLQSCSFIFYSVIWYLPIKAEWVYHGLRSGHRQPRGAGGGVGVQWVFEKTFDNPKWGKVKQMQAM